MVFVVLSIARDSILISVFFIFVFSSIDILLNQTLFLLGEFVSWLCFFEFLHSFKNYGLFVQILRQSCQNFVKIFRIFLIFSMAYVLSVWMLFQDTWHFKDFHASFYSLFSFMVGDIIFGLLQTSAWANTVGYLLLLSGIIFFVYFTQGLYAAIITDYFFNDIQFVEGQEEHKVKPPEPANSQQSAIDPSSL